MATRNDIQTFPGTAEQPNASNDLYVTVLFGYNKPDVDGRINLNKKSYLDEFEGRGGVFRNIPRERAEQWAKGLDKKGKPAISRVFIQAILPNNAEEADFIGAIGKSNIPQEKFAAYIRASDTQFIIDTLGQEGAIELASRLSKELAKK